MSNKIARISELERLLKNGQNIISTLTSDHQEITTPEDEMISYDLRAGYDQNNYKNNMSFYNAIAERIAGYIINTGCTKGSLFEAGSGEGIFLPKICTNSECHFSWACGCDISWSRTAIALKHFIQDVGECETNVEFVVGDFFHLPLKDNSVDILYTMQGIYGMGGHEEELIKELYRVTRRYMILIEPSYEMAGFEAKKRMESLGYVKNLKGIAENLGYSIQAYDKFELDLNPLNPAAVLIIKKDFEENKCKYESGGLCCPYTYQSLEKYGNVLFCDKSKLSYPIVNGIPCLTREHAIVTTHMKEVHIISDD